MVQLVEGVEHLVLTGGGDDEEGRMDEDGVEHSVSTGEDDERM